MSEAWVKSATEAVKSKVVGNVRICILGSTKFSDPASEALVQSLAQQLDEALPSRSIVFATGGNPGVQETFTRNCGDGSRTFHIVPEKVSSNFGLGLDVQVGEDNNQRRQVFGALGDIYISIEGGPGVAQEAGDAHARGAYVVPMVRTGGASGGMFDFPPDCRPEFVTEKQWALLGDKSCPVERSAKAATEIVVSIVSEKISLPPWELPGDKYLAPPQTGFESWGEWQLPLEENPAPELPLKSLGTASCPHGSPLHAPWYEKYRVITPRGQKIGPVLDDHPVEERASMVSTTSLTAWINSLGERRSLQSFENDRMQQSAGVATKSASASHGRRRQTVASSPAGRVQPSKNEYRDLNAIVSPKEVVVGRRRSSNASLQDGGASRSFSNDSEPVMPFGRSKSWPPFPHPRRPDDLAAELEDVPSVFDGYATEEGLSRVTSATSRDRMQHITTLSRRTLEVRKSIRHCLSEADLQMRAKIEAADQNDRNKRAWNIFRGINMGSSALARGFSYIHNARINFRQRMFSSGSMTSVSSSLSQELEKIFVVITLSDQAVELFISEGRPMSCCGFAKLQVSFILIAAVITALLSDMADLGFLAYLGLVRMEDLGLPLLGGSIGLALILHVLGCYSWQVRARVKVQLFAICLLIFTSGWLALTKYYPEIPLITGVLVFPLVMGLWRFCTAGRVSSFSFHVACSLCCLFTGLSTLIAWVVWIGVDDSGWNSKTKQRLQASMSEIHREYKLTNWEQCKEERLLETDKELMHSCSHVELIAFLVWVCPLAESTALIALSIFLAMRSWFMLRSQRSENEDESGAHFGKAQKIVFFVFILIGVFWIACSTAGASMGLSSTYLFGLGVLVVLFCVWLFFTVRLEDLVRQMRGSLLWTLVSPWFKSDWARALAFCMSSLAVMGLLVLEVLTRQVERLCRSEGESKWVTDRGLRLLRRLDNWHWPSILEKSWVCSFIFLLVWVVFSKLAIVFLSWFNGLLSDMNLLVVIALYYAVGLVMFMLPPITGIVVYMGAGVILVSRGMREPWCTFSMGVVYAAAVSMALKINAFIVQHKFIGEAMGHSPKVQQLVVVHNIGTVAMERILSRPGLRLDKVMVLCGGPDWPTAVISGILKLNVWQMILGSLPCLFLIVPSVLAGACLLEDSLAPIAPLTVLLMGFLQGAVFVAALIFTAREATVHKREMRIARSASMEDLSKIRNSSSQVAPSILKWERKRRRNTKEYLNFTTWRNLRCQEKLLLILAVLFQLSTCWITTALSSLCFRPFTLARSIGESFESGGLDGNAFNLLLPLGVTACGLATAGTMLFLTYTAFVRIRQRLARAAAARDDEDCGSPFGSDEEEEDDEAPGTPPPNDPQLHRSSTGQTERSSAQTSGVGTMASVAGSTLSPKFMSESSHSPSISTAGVLHQDIHIMGSTANGYVAAGRPRVLFNQKAQPKNPPREGRAGASSSLKDNPLVTKPGWHEPEPAPTVLSTEV